ncbi:MFS transporter [Aquincola sp. MAHUQ-54]|uniref:MFS transporter n=1 Tax=Aquincola agrisoli TaxID=3119538 RepID=A0AAW9QJ73_9BURK
MNRGVVYRLVALGFAAMFVSTAIKSVYQVYFVEIAGHFGRGRADFAFAGALFMLATGLMSPVVGRLSDRLGPLRTVALGALAAGAALLCVALGSTSLAVFVLAYGVGAAFGLAAMTYVPMGVLVDRLFDSRRKGLAYAVVTNGTAIGFIVLSPLWIVLQPQFAWTTTFLVTGLLFAGPVALLAWLAARSADAAGLGGRAPSPQPGQGVWAQVRKDPVFFVLALGFFGCGATMAFIDVHLVAFWQDAGISRARMGLSLSLLGVLELVSGLATGWLAMRFGKHGLLALFYLLRSAAMLMLLGTGVAGMESLGFAAVFGASYLGTVVLTSMYCFERFGAAVKGQVFGMLFLVHQLGAFASVQFGAMAYDAFGSYRPVVLALSALTVAAAVLSWVGLRGAGSPAPRGARPAPAAGNVAVGE